MMKNIYNLMLAAGMLLAGMVSNAQTHTAGVKVVKQEQDQWCWAADSKCILDYYGFPNAQCTIVEYARTVRPGGYFGSKNCCPKTTTCNKPNEIKNDYGIKGMLKNFGQIESVAGNGALSVSKIISELKAKRPFVIGVFWNAGGGHVIVGCAYNESTASLTFMDSWQNNGMTTKKYSGGSSFSTNTGTGTWQEHLVLLSSPVGINKSANTNNTVRLYPNPSLTDGFTVSADVPLTLVLVFNATGQLVNSYSSISDKSLAIKISVAGFYTLQVITEKGVTTQKVLVQ